MFGLSSIEGRNKDEWMIFYIDYIIHGHPSCLNDFQRGVGPNPNPYCPCILIYIEDSQLVKFGEITNIYVYFVPKLLGILRRKEQEWTHNALFRQHFKVTLLCYGDIAWSPIPLPSILIIVEDSYSFLCLLCLSLTLKCLTNPGWVVNCNFDGRCNPSFSCQLVIPFARGVCNRTMRNWAHGELGRGGERMVWI